ncbi:MAG TPA: condensation domain-containing protein [Pyrinomonadaceae bacterium]|nr:condensation domain-containing protein [Pyrinomonadaceae bacterium]
MKTNSMFRLADSALVEPLVNQWPAWSHMIPPVTASLHLLHHQIPTLQSYLKNPELHASLARDPKYAGSPFSDIPPHRAGEMQELLASMQEKQRANLDFAKALGDFHNWLVDEARGQCLEPYYAQIPDLLRGYVELVYDYYNNPTVRFLEPMLYESEYYDSSLQSLRLSQLRHDSRPFFMSTPRLKDEDQIDWTLPFESSLVNDFFRLDLKPQPLSRIREILHLEVADDQLLLPLLTEEPVSLPHKWRERQVRIKYFGHACVLIEWNGVSILTDPCVAPTPSEGGFARHSYNDLPERIDFGVVTHSHQDHFVPETLLRLRPRIECLVVPKAYGVLFGDISLKLLAQKIGFKHVLELDTLEAIPLPDGEIVGIPFLGEHGDLAQGKLAYLVRAGKEQMLFAADSDCLDQQMYHRLRKIVGPIETVFVGTESVGAPLTWHNGSNFLRRPTREQNKTRRYHGCNAHRALQLLEAVKARRIYVYAMGKEPWFEHLLGFGTGEDSPQLKESRTLIARAGGRGFTVAERPFGRGEIYIGREETKDVVQGRTDSFTVNAAEVDSPTRGSFERSLVYWRRQLSGLSPVFALPQVQGSQQTRDQQSIVFSERLSNALAQFSRQYGYSLLTVMLAGFQTLLYWYTGKDDIVIGSQAGDLSLSETGTRSEFPTDFLALRTDLSCEPEFLNLLDRARGVVGMALAHQDVPYDVLTQNLKFEDDSAGPNLSQVMFRFIKAPLTLQDIESQEVNIECVLALTLFEEEDRIAGVLQYDTDSFASATIAAMLEHYQSLLESIVENPKQTITDFSFAAVDGKNDGAPAILKDLNHLEDQFVF